MCAEGWLDWARNWSSLEEPQLWRKPAHLSGMAEVRPAEGQSCEPKGTAGGFRGVILEETEFVREKEVPLLGRQRFVPPE